MKYVVLQCQLLYRVHVFRYQRFISRHDVPNGRSTTPYSPISITPGVQMHRHSLASFHGVLGVRPSSICSSHNLDDDICETDRAVIDLIESPPMEASSNMHWASVTTSQPSGRATSRLLPTSRTHICDYDQAFKGKRVVLSRTCSL